MVAQGPDGRTICKAATVTSSSPRPSCSSASGYLERRYNKSCEFIHPPNNHHNDAISLRSSNNPIAQVCLPLLKN
uniref:Uncharacterized protein n=1 Tax=Panagrolaimus sp. PS1159 TaxID=55785 RepID=A0AC35FSC2_9BILA